MRDQEDRALGRGAPFLLYQLAKWWPHEPQDIHGLTQVQDLLPTLLDLCDIPNDAKFDGMSLASILRGKAVVPEDRMLVINTAVCPIS